MGGIGLILSGGFGKGAYQIGALTALSEYFKPTDFTAVSAASIGALNAYGYLSGNLSEICEMWKSIDFKGCKRSVLSVMHGPFMKNIISRISEGKLPVPFYMPLFDLDHRKLDYCPLTKIPHESAGDYLAAGISLPFISSGKKIGGSHMYDGGIVDNIPILPLLDYNLDYMICIYFDEMFLFENPDADSKIIKITFPDNTMIRNSLDIRHESVMYMIDEGYRRTKRILSAVLARGKNDLEYIYQGIRRLNENSGESKHRVTMDVAISNLNKILRRVERRTIRGIRNASDSPENA